MLRPLAGAWSGCKFAAQRSEVAHLDVLSLEPCLSQGAWLERGNDLASSRVLGRFASGRPGCDLTSVSVLLAVDVGLRTGLALFGADGRLVSYRSQNFGTPARLRRAAFGLLIELPHLKWLILEGGGQLAEIWKRAGERRGVVVVQIGAERWRERLLYDRERRSGEAAKAHAGELARRVITWAGAPRPTSLRHDAAEAIMIGLWGALEVGLLGQLPETLRQ